MQGFDFMAMHAPAASAYLVAKFRTINSKVLQLENNIVGGKDTVANRILQTLDNK